jgi:hypothetical protein
LAIDVSWIKLITKKSNRTREFVMLKITPVVHYLPLAFIACLAQVLVACGSNSASTTIGPLPVIDPITVDKTISPIDWDQNNEVEMASHGYRGIVKNSLLIVVFTQKLVPLDLTVTLFPSVNDRSCRVSGRIISEIAETECFAEDGTSKVDCRTGDAVIRIDPSLSQAIKCQDGNLFGQYTDGFFNIFQKTDLTYLSEEDEFRTSTTISAINTIPKLDNMEEPVVDKRPDYLFQNDSVILFFDNEYETYVDLTTCDGDTYEYIARTGMRSFDVGFLEGDGIRNYYPYTQYTDLKLESIPVDACDDKEEYNYSLSAIMANAAMGGGVNRNTAVTWPDMDISLAGGDPSGTLTLVHENEDGDYTLTLNFNTEEGLVTITSPSENSPITLQLADFLALSQPSTIE